MRTIALAAILLSLAGTTQASSRSLATRGASAGYSPEGESVAGRRYRTAVPGAESLMAEEIEVS